jgi:hypothetical protein
MQTMLTTFLRSNTCTTLFPSVSWIQPHERAALITLATAMPTQHIAHRCMGSVPYSVPPVPFPARLNTSVTCRGRNSSCEPAQCAASGHVVTLFNYRRRLCTAAGSGQSTAAWSGLPRERPWQEGSQRGQASCVAAAVQSFLDGKPFTVAKVRTVENACMNPEAGAGHACGLRGLNTAGGESRLSCVMLSLS